MQVKDLTVEEFKELIREVIDDVLEEVSVDSDEGKLIRPEIQQELQKRQHSRQTGESKLVSSQEVMKELGIE
ncbi:hypothetical protein PCC7418_1282 [Halothece sp. PCC 7418]|uniref:hypothetical protein n=1 Tax=Halothece sp. (strain PCC 7418) TaxID=65093 RepID=UPI0002A083F2|nr:hypothetical protein [Halothece sp. PCC 7418]AFZ43481.1 hypothetical protein PCC7418_1282 [Halothece sp. PCC 7418]